MGSPSYAARMDTRGLPIDGCAILSPSSPAAAVDRYQSLRRGHRVTAETIGHCALRRRDNDRWVGQSEPRAPLRYGSISSAILLVSLMLGSCRHRARAADVTRA